MNRILVLKTMVIGNVNIYVRMSVILADYCDTQLYIYSLSYVLC